MPLMGRFRSISEHFQDEWVFIGSEFKADIEKLANARIYEGYPRVEYVGKMPLNRDCKHGRPMNQLKMHINSISTQHFEDLIEMGWRRDGLNFYKTIMDCCHTYALRLDPRSFKPSKTHRKIINHFYDFLNNGATKNVKKNKQSEEATLEAYVEKLFDENNQHKLEARYVKPGSREFYETYEESFELFRKYQEHVFKNLVSREDFERMVVASPLKADDKEYFSGTFYRQTLLDGRIIGVEMFDILPSYILGQTQYYDPDLSDLNLGTCMILNQILSTKKLSETLNRPLHLSTGLYNHCFKKHHYKLQFANEILVGPKQWIPLTKDLVPMLDNEEKIRSQEEKLMKFPEIESIRCLYNGKVVKYGVLEEILSMERLNEARMRMMEFVQEVGEVSMKTIYCVLFFIGV